jgi:hypothetical protein
MWVQTCEKTTFQIPPIVLRARYAPITIAISKTMSRVEVTIKTILLFWALNGDSQKSKLSIRNAIVWVCIPQWDADVIAKAIHVIITPATPKREAVSNSVQAKRSGSANTPYHYAWVSEPCSACQYCDFSSMIPHDNTENTCRLVESVRCIVCRNAHS